MKYYITPDNHMIEYKGWTVYIRRQDVWGSNQFHVMFTVSSSIIFQIIFNMIEQGLISRDDYSSHYQKIQNEMEQFKNEATINIDREIIDYFSYTQKLASKATERAKLYIDRNLGDVISYIKKHS